MACDYIYLINQKPCQMILLQVLRVVLMKWKPSKTVQLNPRETVDVDIETQDYYPH